VQRYASHDGARWDAMTELRLTAMKSPREKEKYDLNPRYRSSEDA